MLWRFEWRSWSDHLLTLAALCLVACGSQPERTPGLGEYGRAALAHPRFAWDSVRGTGFTLYTPRGSYATSRAAQYRAEMSAGIGRALTMLNEPHYPGHLHMFVMRSRADIEAVTGTGWNGWTDAAGNSAAVVARPECTPVFRHEIMHAVSLAVWGHPLGPDGVRTPPVDPTLFALGGWLREGIAAAAEDRYLRYTYRGMSAQWLAETSLLPLDTLISGFYRVDDLAAYLQAGSLVQFVLNQYGVTRFRQLWRDGPSAFPRAYNRTPSQIESEWHTWLRATPASERPASIAVARSEDRCPPRRTS